MLDRAQPKEWLDPSQILEALKAVCAEDFLAGRLTAWAEGATAQKSHQVWVQTRRESLRKAVQRLIQIHYPHLGVISCSDRGATIEMLYHLFVYHGQPHREIMVTLSFEVPKTDPVVPTITDLIPGALTSEREKQEMIGVRITDIPDNRRMFLPDDFPAGVYPWRKDETGPTANLLKELWSTGREEYLARTIVEAPKPPATAQNEN